MNSLASVLLGKDVGVCVEKEKVGWGMKVAYIGENGKIILETNGGFGLPDYVSVAFDKCNVCVGQDKDTIVASRMSALVPEKINYSSERETGYGLTGGAQ